MKKNRYAQPDQITKIEVELTNRCNAQCPSCSRTDFDGKALRSLPLNDISLATFKKILPNKWLRGREIKLCGVFGDPMVANDILPIIEYIMENDAHLTINTNGGMRDVRFWQTLGHLLAKYSNKHQLIFSIDGLADTNHIYRRNVSWPKLLENAKAFIGAGGCAHWDFLVFSHNEHQVEEVRHLSHELGFRKFTLKKTTRSSELKKPTVVESALDIAPSRREEFRNPALLQKRNATAMKFMNFFSHKREKEIECFSRGESSFIKQPDTSVYISANLRVWPCCWFADAEFPQKREIRDLFKKFGPEFNNLAHHSLEEVLDSPWYNSALVGSWYSPKTCSPICALNCNKKMPLNNEDCEDTYFA